MTGIADEFQDAILDAQAEIMEALREVGRELLLPTIEKNAKAVWAQMSPEMKEQFKQERPEEYAALMKGLER